MVKFKIIFIILLLPFYFYLLTSTAYAIVDPLSVPNNKFGIHIIQATPGESSPAAQLANSSGGDWGYITILIENKDRSHEKWQEFFNDLRKRHLIPLVRLATKPVNEHWERPYEGEEQAWADFLDRLNWPTKNRYVIIYNEPNHAKEWGNFVDPKSYARVLDKTITTLKTKNSDFFVLNAGFDASAPQEPPFYQDQVNFMQQMEDEVPGIFNKLDGWVSHSYPNPNFSGSPNSYGRGTVRTYLWELQLLKQFGVKADMPVFITETGWKHAEGLSYDNSLLPSETVADYLKLAYQNAWSDKSVVAVTPFLLNYQEVPFDHFSFQRVQEQDFYPQFQAVSDLPKTSGKPIQDNLAKLEKGEVYSSIVSGQSYTISLTFKNTGQSIWDKDVKLVPVAGGKELGIDTVSISQEEEVAPGQQYSFDFEIKASQSGKYKIVLNLYAGNIQFDSQPLGFTTEVKEPVILKVLTRLKWRESAAGEYILRVSGIMGESTQKVILDQNGQSKPIEARHLLPDYSFDFTLEKPYYKPRNIAQKLKTGENIAISQRTLEFITILKLTHLYPRLM